MFATSRRRSTGAVRHPTLPQTTPEHPYALAAGQPRPPAHHLPCSLTSPATGTIGPKQAARVRPMLALIRPLASSLRTLCREVRSGYCSIGNLPSQAADAWMYLLAGMASQVDQHSLPVRGRYATHPDVQSIPNSRSEPTRHLHNFLPSLDLTNSENVAFPYYQALLY